MGARTSWKNDIFMDQKCPTIWKGLAVITLASSMPSQRILTQNVNFMSAYEARTTAANATGCTAFSRIVLMLPYGLRSRSISWELWNWKGNLKLNSSLTINLSMN